MAELVGQRAEQSSLAGIPKVVPVDLYPSEAGFPGIARPNRLVRPAGGIFGKVRVFDINLEPGTDLASGPDINLCLIAAVDVPPLEGARLPFPCGPSVRDPVAPRLAGSLEHGAEGGVIANLPPRSREVEFDRQRVGRAAGPAPIGHAAASPKDAHLVAVLKIGGHRRLVVRPRSRLKTPKVRRVVPIGGLDQGEALHDPMCLPMPPMIEKVSGGGVVARALGQTHTAWVRVEDDGRLQ